MTSIGDYSLPVGWALPRISEVAYVNPRTWDEEVEGDDLISFVPMAAVEAGSGRLDPSLTLAVNKLKQGYTRFQEGDVLFAKITPCMENGKCAIASGLTGGKGAGSTEFHVLRPSRAVHPKLLFHFLLRESFRAEARAKMKGAAGQLRVPPEFLSQAQIPLAPSAEQERIVEEIEKHFTRLDAAVTGLKRVQANLKRYRDSVLKAACEGRLVPTEADLAKAEGRDHEPADKLLARIFKERRTKWEDDQLAKMKDQGKMPKDDNWKNKYEGPKKLDTLNLPGVPKGWIWATLDSIGQEGRPIIYGIIKPGPHITDGVPYVRVTEMKDGRIDVATLRRTSPERAARFARATLAAGDILISKDGTIGRVAVVPPELAGGNITQHVMRAPVHKYVCRDYIVWAVRSPDCQRWLTGETRGVALQGVNVEDFRRLPIPIPPVAEQYRITSEVERRLSVVEEIEASIEVNLIRAERLRQAILKRAFEGKLVPQDPADEQASVLLEQVRSEHAANSGHSKNQRKTSKLKTQLQSKYPTFKEMEAHS